MTYRLFEGKDHAFMYHKHWIPPPEEVKNLILQYLDKKVCHCQTQKSYSVSAVHHCAIVHILRRDSHMFWQWTWGVGRVNSCGCWRPTSSRWWELTWASWSRPELCQGTPTSHTGKSVGQLNMYGKDFGCAKCTPLQHIACAGIKSNIASYTYHALCSELSVLHVPGCLPARAASILTRDWLTNLSYLPDPPISLLCAAPATGKKV